MRTMRLAMMASATLLIIPGVAGARPRQPAANTIRITHSYNHAGMRHWSWSPVNDRGLPTSVIVALRRGGLKAAVPRLIASANSGYAFSMRVLATLYARGEGVPRNDALALHWLNLAAHHGDAVSMYALGEAYANGTGVERDTELARYWLEQADDYGDHRADKALDALAR